MNRRDKLRLSQSNHRRHVVVLVAGAALVFGASAGVVDASVAVAALSLLAVALRPST